MSLSETNKGYVPRISQLDSIILNEEAYSLLKSQLLAAVKYVGQSSLTRFEPEIDAGLRYILLKCTIQKARSSIGQQLLQIKYDDLVSNKRLRNYVLLLVLGRWLKQRAGNVATVVFRNENAGLFTSQCINVFEILYMVSQLLNLLVFLKEGIYPSVFERMLRLKPVSSNIRNIRKLSYVYFTRELLWHGFAELLSFVLPLINVQYFHSIVRRLLPSAVDNDYAEEQEVSFHQHTTCVVCNCPPTLPHNYGCQHLACYYCIHSSYALDPTYSCPLCGHTIESKVQIIPVYTVKG
ncbi:peroxisome biogenesis factor 2-like [Penaeus chinensis]|uniref:peroxisome biogenesis factor 2-like n=1 Tax=Penaeus chinensis TaxID=139456 RepID=UPI001FB81048|nr:peroxisome biogenesis factor 2-like [Penaeus chinensis]